MTKKEARAILTCKRRILDALVLCEKQLKGDTLTFMVHYWGNSIRCICSDGQYGAMPVLDAQEKVQS